jgi:hypothetical protein
MDLAVNVSKSDKPFPCMMNSAASRSTRQRQTLWGAPVDHLLFLFRGVIRIDCRKVAPRPRPSCEGVEDKRDEGEEDE